MNFVLFPRFKRLARRAGIGGAWMVGISAAKPAAAQLPPGLPVPPINYATTHLWGPPEAISIEHFALGGAFVADNQSDWHGNPAGVLADTRPTVLTYTMSADFDKLPTVHSSFFGYAGPLGQGGRSAIKIAFVPVRASGSLTGTPIRARLRENDPEVEFSFRASHQLWLGVGLSYLQTDSDYSIPGVGVVTHLESRPSSLGGRLGLIYQCTARLSLGATVDRYSERVEQSVPALGVPATAFNFDSAAYRVGLKYEPDAQTKVLLDYQATQLKGNDTQINHRPLMLGVERKIREVALRVGSFDGKLTGGLGYTRGRLTADYGFSGRYAKDLPGQGAKTAHAVQLRYQF